MHYQNERGFTLMELVVTVAFMGIVIVSIMELFTSLRQINRTSNNYTIATQVAQQLVEQYRNTPYNSLSATGTPVDVTTAALGPYPSLLAPRSATVTITSVDALGLKQVDVKVSYKDRAGIKKAELTTLVSWKGINR